MKRIIFFIMLALLIFLSACQSPTSPTSTEPKAIPGTIQGTVTDSVYSNMRIGGVSVWTQPATKTVKTNDQGVYTIADVPPGSYTVTVQGPWPYKDTSVNVSVTAGQTATADIALQWATTGKIVCAVFNSDTGMPISGATVSTQPATKTVTTDYSGYCQISDVAPGSYKVTVSASGYKSDSRNVDVKAAEQTNVTFRLHKG